MMMAMSATAHAGKTNLLTCTLGVTDRPGPIVWSAGNGSSKTIFTGTRWTTFTKLPVAFSGGNKLNAAPLPACTLSTCAAKFAAAKRVNLHRHRLAGPHVLQLRFLEVRHDPHVRWHDGHDLLPDFQIIAGLDGLARDAAIARRENFRVGQIQFRGGDVPFAIR